MSLAVAIQMDPIESVNIDADSSFVLGLEAQRRGHGLFHYLPRDMFFRDGRIFATARAMKLKRERGNHHQMGNAELLDLAGLAAPDLYQGRSILAPESHIALFFTDYSFMGFDPRGIRDRYTDYFQNSAIATDVHRRFCLDLAQQFPDYSDDLWGITASDSPKGYAVWGGPAAGPPAIAFHPVERIEQMFQRIRGNAGTEVPHSNPEP